MRNNKKIAIVGIVGIPACYGGFESLVENLTLHKSDCIDYTVFCSSKSYKNKLGSHNNAKLIYLPIKANGVQSIAYDILSLLKCLKVKPDVVLILGVSGCIFLPFFKLFSKAKIVTNIDGLEWKRDKWGWMVKKFLKLSERIAVRFSDVVISDNQAISDYINVEYGKDNVTIAYGGDHAIRDSFVNIESNRIPETYSLGLCRIEPENNVEMILEAFSKTSNKIKFVGNWDASEFGRNIKEKYCSYNNIELLDPIYDLDLLYKLRKECSIYIHGHSAGGTNPSLVEMMHFEVPVLAFDCSFNRYSTDGKANYFKNSDDLIKLLSVDIDEYFMSNRIAMREIALMRYTWEKISIGYEETYF